MDLPILSPPLLKCDTGCARCWSNYSGFGLRNFRMRNALRDLLEIASEAGVLGALFGCFTRYKKNLYMEY